MKKIDAYRLFLILSASVSFLFGMIFAASSIYQVTVVKLSALELVLVGTVLELSVFLFEVPTGVVADIKSRRLSIIIGYVLIGIGFILEGTMPLFVAILLGQVLWGVGFTFTSGATQAWITDEIGEERAAKAFLRAGQAGNISGLAGLALGVLIGRQQVNIPIFVGGVLLLVLVLFLSLCLRLVFTQPSAASAAPGSTCWIPLMMAYEPCAAARYYWISFGSASSTACIAKGLTACGCDWTDQWGPSGRAGWTAFIRAGGPHCFQLAAAAQPGIICAFRSPQ